MNFKDDGLEIHRGVLKGDLPGFIGRMVASNPWNPVDVPAGETWVGNPAMRLR